MYQSLGMPNKEFDRGKEGEILVRVFGEGEERGRF